MAKYHKSLWDDFDDEGGEPEGTKKSTGPRPNPNYRGADDIGDEDELASDDYGGYGWSGKFSGGFTGGSYRYDDAFDDSEDHWYRKNSFRYGKHADYSPSSLFRSTFSRNYSSGSDDNEAKNKAIRALRNLTRSANTIVDKSSGIKNEFAVQFSAGSDTNGAIAKLNDDKQRVVFVSPDELLAAKTTEEEDATVDALTGFVLLRVQMAQDIAADVVTRINNTGAHLMGTRVAAQFAKPGAKELAELKPEEMSELSGAAVDDYLAGMLAKSVLMRLSRRKVVHNWGGFAPYFIRHAKKFAAVRENLAAAKLSVESVVGRLGYNMLADEDQIPVDKDFEAIAAKHLGEEVAMADLLLACKKLVSDIRAAMAAHAEAVPGEMEEALNEMLAAAQAAQAASGSGGEKDLRDFLKNFADGVTAAHNPAIEAREAGSSAQAAENDLLGNLRTAMSAEQLLKKLADKVKEIEALLKETAHEDPAVALNAKARLANTLNQEIEHLFQSRPQAVRGLVQAGLAAERLELAKEYEKRPGLTGGDDAAVQAAAKKLQEKIEQLIAKAAKTAKSARDARKAATQAAIAKMQERLEKAAAQLTASAESAEDNLEKLKTTSAVDAATKRNAEEILSNISALMRTFCANIKNTEESVRALAVTASKARSAGALEKALRQAQNFTQNVEARLAQFTGGGYGGYGGYSWTAVDAVRQLLTALSAMSSFCHDRNAVIDAAVEDVINRRVVGSAGFAAAMALAAAGNKALEAAELPNIAGAEDTTDEAERVDLRLDAATIKRINQLIESMRSSGLSTTRAEKAGSATAEKLQEIQEKSSPVDGELFGETVAASTMILDSESIGRVNDEARNDPEEEYIAYLSHNSAKPKVGTAKEGHSSYRGHRAGVVKEVRAKHRGSIERIRNALQFQSGKRTAENFGLRSGDLDEGSLHKLSYDCDNIWSQKTVSKLPDVAVGILVDQSGSMSGPKIEKAREVCIVLAEALKKIAGVRLYVYGHTANNGAQDLTIYEHYTPTSSDLLALGGISSHSNNYDGYAIKDVAKRLALDSAKRKYLFVIADGLPSGHGYGGETAEKHVTSVCKFVRDRLKIGLNAFAVGVGMQKAAFKRQYGDDHVVFIDDLMKCLPQIVRFLRNTLQKERKLVGLED